jgi:hypothetical protein
MPLAIPTKREDTINATKAFNFITVTRSNNITIAEIKITMGMKIWLVVIIELHSHQPCISKCKLREITADNKNKFTERESIINRYNKVY